MSDHRWQSLDQQWGTSVDTSRRRMLRCYLEENGVTPKMGDALDAAAVMWHACKMWGVRE